ncbi:hypothetical protein SVAN01_07794 [Stagonosporopsis vannaccii]|nr:hypothetical protein SVAN01_07794 [Stagonosporopsis vannaccii]
MSKILAVFGATGQQGSSVVDYVLNDSELSQQYKIRAITSNMDSEKARRLKEKVEVVHGDMLDRASLETALTGVHTVFAMTAPSLDPEVEYNIVKTMADVAVEKDAEYIIFSTLPSIHELSGGKYTKVTLFDAKARAERYIRGLRIKSAFCSLGSFMENFQSQSFLAPRKKDHGAWVVALHVSPKIQWPLIHAVRDTGKFVGAILAEPEKYNGKTFCAATKFYTLEEMIAIMSKATGKTIRYERISQEEFVKSMALPEVVTDMFVEMLGFLEETGYFGPDGEELVAWAVKNARGRLSTFEEYLETHPLRLE